MVTEAYAVDEMVHIDPSVPVMPAERISPALTKTIEIGSLCNNASMTRNENGEFVGQSTDVALLNVLDVFGIPDQRQVRVVSIGFRAALYVLYHQNFTRLSERPFNSEQKYMAVSGAHGLANTAHLNIPPREMYYIKGSIDAILDRCRFYYVSDESTPGLDVNTRSVILSKAQATASRGLRVIAMAYGHGSVEPATKSSASSPIRSSPPTRSSSPDRGHEKDNLVFVGFQAMLDPPRKGVADAIGLLQSGGVQVVMITGDAEQTALSIAQKLGLRVGPRRSSGAEQSRYCLTGKAIDLMTKDQLKERVGSVSVFARTTPRHKMAIVEAFQSRGAVVAMTGDGGTNAFFERRIG
jgi:Ca2+-transporting ATPase